MLQACEDEIDSSLISLAELNELANAYLFLPVYRKIFKNEESRENGMLIQNPESPFTHSHFKWPNFTKSQRTHSLTAIPGGIKKQQKRQLNLLEANNTAKSVKSIVHGVATGNSVDERHVENQGLIGGSMREVLENTFNHLAIQKRKAHEERLRLSKNEYLASLKNLMHKKNRAELQRSHYNRRKLVVLDHSRISRQSPSGSKSAGKINKYYPSN
jgi:hypothetical protein